MVSSYSARRIKGQRLSNAIKFSLYERIDDPASAGTESQRQQESVL